MTGPRLSALVWMVVEQCCGHLQSSRKGQRVSSSTESVGQGEHLLISEEGTLEAGEQGWVLFEDVPCYLWDLNL